MLYSFMDPSKRWAATALVVLGALGLIVLRATDWPETLMMWVCGVGFAAGLIWWGLRLSFLAQTQYRETR